MSAARSPSRRDAGRRADPTPRCVLLFGDDLNALVLQTFPADWQDEVRFLTSMTGQGHSVLTLTSTQADKGLALPASRAATSGSRRATSSPWAIPRLDIEMFKVAGASVAMGQASSAVKRRRHGSRRGMTTTALAAPSRAFSTDASPRTDRNDLGRLCVDCHMTKLEGRLEPREVARRSGTVGRGGVVPRGFVDEAGVDTTRAHDRRGHLVGRVLGEVVRASATRRSPGCGARRRSAGTRRPSSRSPTRRSGSGPSSGTTTSTPSAARRSGSGRGSASASIRCRSTWRGR